jgi:hypothetical protein
MPHRRYEDDDDDDTPRRRRGNGASKAPLFVGVGVAVTVVIVAVIVTVVVRRGGRGLQNEEVTEDGVRVVTDRGIGSDTVKQYLPPADGRPYGMRHDREGVRPDRKALTEGWGLMLGKWERKDEQGKVHVAEFRADHTATVTIRFADGLKTSEYELSCITDMSEFRPLPKTVRRKYDVTLRFPDQRDKVVHVQCDILADGTLATGSNETKPYTRVR